MIDKMSGKVAYAVRDLEASSALETIIIRFRGNR